MTASRLDEQLCFALYAASRAMTAAYRPLLDELKLTYPQYLVLLVLWERNPVTVSYLCERLHLDSGTLSPLLKRLEIVGYITRRRSQTDERRVDVALTRDGRKLEQQAECIPEKLLESANLNIVDAAELRDSLHLLAQHLTHPKKGMEA